MSVYTRDALWSEGVDETVEVNQRALIDKILARYSGEHTVFRELLQNADDARSTNIEIRFDTATSKATTATDFPNSSRSSLPDLETVDITKWTFRNDGDRFQPDDWNRLKKIAEGNPDESKIGAFGVGFYALFSVTERPFVTSGDDWLGFYWKDGKDQLYVRRGQLPNVSPQDANWTSFEMDLRERAPLSTKPTDLAKFYATSITFMNYIRQISVFVDQHRLFTISKTPGVSEPVRWPLQLKNEGPLNYMKMSSVSLQDVVIVASLTRWMHALGSDSTVTEEKRLAKRKAIPSAFFARLNPLSPRSASSSIPEVDAPPSPGRLTDKEKLQVIERSVRLQIYTGDITVNLPPNTASGIERATRKKSPSNITYQIVYTDKKSYDASVDEDDGSDFSVFQGVRADLDGTGSARVFIGHSTAQSTGVGGHHASRFIPTVEREALDLVDPMVATFNKELLAMGGLLCRVIYETGVDEIEQMWERSAASHDDSEHELEDKFTHLLRFLAFRRSAPSPAVSPIMKTAFICASRGEGIRLLSSTGVKQSTEVRCYSTNLCSFLKTTPFLKSTVSPLAESLLTSTSMAVRDVDMKDILNELQSRSLSEEEMINCLKWRLSLGDSIVKTNTKSLNADFLAAARVFIPAGATKTDRVIWLDQIQTYYSSSNGVIRESPLPPHTLPRRLEEALPSNELAEAFPWKPLSPSVWLQFLAVDGVDSIADEFQITQASFVQRVLLTISEEAWGIKMSPEEKSSTKSVLANEHCIPTNLGMQIPSASYLPNVNMFPNLPIVSLPGAEKKGALQEMLKDLGVRDHVDLQLIFRRYVASGQWSTPRLMSYFVSIQDRLTKDEMTMLRETRMFIAAPGSSMAPEDGKVPMRYLPNQLHEPRSENISLGLPVLHWVDSTWDPKSPEAQFIFSIGLLKHPSVDTLVEIASSNYTAKRDEALHYLLSRFDEHYRRSYTLGVHGKIPFVPAVLPDGSPKFLSPAKVFAQPGCAILGFPAVREDIRRESRKLQIPDHPNATQLVKALVVSPPNTFEAQKKTFEYLSSQLNGFQPFHLRTLQNAPFILVREGENKLFMKPSECYIGCGEGTINENFFTFVDPQGPVAQSFLVACGARSEPSSQEVVHALLRNPQSFFTLVGGESAYLTELRQIAISVQKNRIDQRTQDRMKSAPIFFAYKAVAVPPKSFSEGDAEGGKMGAATESCLLKPEDVIIVDDTFKYRLFKESIWVAPQEDFLEKFYRNFGSSPISALVQETVSVSGVGNPATARHIRELVLERLPIFLDERVGAPPEFKFTWLKAPGNFIVKSVEVVEVHNILQIGRQKLDKSHRASAGSTRTGKSPVTLYVATSEPNAQPNLLCVAQAVCQAMLKDHTRNDIMAFSYILSTDLEALKDLYDVDRILARQSENAGPPSERTESTMVFDPVEEPTSLNNILNNITTLGILLGAGPPPPYSSRTMTPKQSIERNIQLALAACGGAHFDRINTRIQMSVVKEAQNSGYCNESAKANMRFIKEVAGFRIWAGNGIANPDIVIGAKQAAIERFGNILAVLRDQVFNINNNSVSIFYDSGGPLVAFNRYGSIFVNLRAYEEWYDESIAKGQRVEATSYYYFVFGHQIAHNLVLEHNAEHEFYFSALCEKHLAPLLNYLH